MSRSARLLLVRGEGVKRLPFIRLRVGLALEDRERRSLRVGDHSDAAAEDLGGRRYRAPADALRVARGVVGVLDREVGEPVRRDPSLLICLGADASIQA